MNKRCKNILITLAKATATLLVVVALWYVSALVANNELVVPAPHVVAKETFSLLGNGQTYVALLVTLARAVVAFGASMLVALTLCLLVNVFPPSRGWVDGIVTFCRALPTVALILMVMLALPSSVVPMLVAFLVAFPVVYSAFCREVDANQGLVKLAKVYNVTPRNKCRFVLLPLVGQVVLPQVKDGIPLCIKVVIAGEVLALPGLGIGQQMYIAKNGLDISKVIALTLLALVVCFAVSGVCSFVQRRSK